MSPGLILEIASSEACLDLVEDVRAQAVEVVDAELVHHLDQAAAADLVAGRQRVDVADHLDRLAHVGGDDVDQQSGRPCLRARSASAGCRGLPRRPGARRRPCRGRRCRRRGRCEANSATILPRRKVGVTKVKSCRWPVPFHGSLVMIDVALLHRLRREAVEEVIDRAGHRVDVARRAGHGLGQHRAREVEHAGGEVARLARRRSRSRCASASAPAPRRPRSGGPTSVAGEWATADR